VLSYLATDEAKHGTGKAEARKRIVALWEICGTESPMYAAKLSVLMFYTYNDPEEARGWLNRTVHFYDNSLNRYGGEDQAELNKIGDRVKEMKKFVENAEKGENL
jgi:hypothetical protein